MTKFRVLLLFPILACANQPPPAATESAPTAPQPLHVIMQQHFVYVDDLQKAVIAGELDQARASAQWLLDNHVTGLNKGWTPHIEALEAAASVVIAAPDLAQASLGAAQVAGACGGCHAAHGLDIGLTAPPMAEGDGTKAHMQRHQWAADRMWDAVVGNSNAAWLEAATALQDAPLLRDGDPESDLVEMLQTVSGVVHDVGDRSQKLMERPERVRALGELLSTCAACHGALGIEPYNR